VKAKVRTPSQTGRSQVFFVPAVASHFARYLLGYVIGISVGH